MLNQGIDTGAVKYGNERTTKRMTAFQGIPVRLEIEAGEHVIGNGWENTYKYPYGEIPNSHALSDGDPVDVYLGPNGQSDLVVVVHQNKRDGTFDEDKVMLGFNSERDAVQCYFDHGPEWGFGSSETMTFDQFVKGYLAANRLLNERGIIPIALALIVAGAILISGFMIAYKPEIHCSVGDNGKPHKYNGYGTNALIIDPINNTLPTYGTFDTSIVNMNNKMIVGGR